MATGTPADIFLATVSDQSLQLAAVSVFVALTGAIGVLYRDQRKQEQSHRADLKAALEVMQEQSNLLSEFRGTVDRQTEAVEKLAQEVARCPHLVA